MNKAIKKVLALCLSLALILGVVPLIVTADHPPSSQQAYFLLDTGERTNALEKTVPAGTTAAELSLPTQVVCKIEEGTPGLSGEGHFVEHTLPITGWDFPEENTPLKEGTYLLTPLLSSSFPVSLALPTVTLTVLAAEEVDDSQRHGVIVSFTPLEPEVAHQIVPLGLSLHELELPETLHAQEKNADGQIDDVQLDVSQWQSDPPYQGERPDEYLFTPQLDDGILLEEGVLPPTIDVSTVSFMMAANGEVVIDLDKLSKTTTTTEYKYDKPLIGTPTLTILPTAKDIRIRMSSTTPLTDRYITVQKGYTGTLTLENVLLSVSNSYPALEIQGGANVKLALDGTSTLRSGGGHAGVRVVDNASLTILDSSGTLNAYGKGGGSGIGGSSLLTVAEPGGSVTIQGGTINATGNNRGAGISGTVTITGGNVTAVGDNGGAGIGGSNGQGPAGPIKITGGTVKATGSVGGAGIGTGWQMVSPVSFLQPEDILIDGGNITATGGADAAGIGGGSHGIAGKITITGGTVKAVAGPGTSSSGGAGIGSGTRGSLASVASGVISIKGSGTHVTATGSPRGAGIGGGNSMPGAYVFISNGATVESNGADNNAHAYSIGSGGDLGIIGGLLYQGGVLKVVDAHLSMDCKDTNANYVLFRNATLTGCDTTQRITVDSLTVDKPKITTNEKASVTVNVTGLASGKTPTGTLRVVVHPPQTSDLDKDGNPINIDNLAVYTHDIKISPSTPSYHFDISGDHSKFKMDTEYEITARYIVGEKDSFKEGSSKTVPSFKITKEVLPVMPAAQYNVLSNRLYDVEDGMEYRVDQGQWIKISSTQVMNVLTAEQQRAGALIEVRRVSDTGLSSDIQRLVLPSSIPLEQLVGHPVKVAGESSGEITGFDPGVAYEYRLKGAGWNSFSGSSSLGNLAAGDYEVRLAAAGNSLASASVTVTVRDRTPPPSLDGVTFDGATATLTGIPPGTEYQIQGGTWKEVPSPLVLSPEDIATLQQNQPASMEFRNPGQPGDEPSPSVSLPIDVQPTPTGLTAQAVTVDGNQQDGKITGLDTQLSYQYRVDNGPWQDVATGASKIDDLAPGSYEIRVKGQGSMLAGTAVELAVVIQGEAPRSAYFNGQNLWLEGVDSTMEYRVGEDSPQWIAVPDSANYIDLSQQGVVEGTKIYLRFSTTPPSDDQEIVIGKQGDAHGTTTPASAAGAADGAIVDLDANLVYEYKTGGNSWTRINSDATDIEDLAPGVYELRLAGGTNLLPGDPLPLTILYAAAPPTATYNALLNHVQGVTTQMEYSVDGGATWVPVTHDSFELALNDDADLQAGIALKIRTVGDDVQTVTSPPQIISLQPGVPIPEGSLTAHPATDSPDGEIQGLDASRTYQYRQQGTDLWISVTGKSTITDLETGRYEIRLMGGENTLPTPSLFLDILQQQPTPQGHFNGLTLELIVDNWNATMDYAKAADGPWIPLASDKTVLDFTDDEILSGATLWVRSRGDGTATTDSASLELTLAAGGTLDPADFPVLPKSTGSTGGSVTGLDVADKYQLRLDGTSQWVEHTGSHRIDGLPLGFHQLRQLHDGSQLPTQPLLLTVTAKPEPPTARYDQKSNTLSDVDRGMEYSVDGGQTWTPIDNDNTPLDLTNQQIQDGLTVQVRYAGNDVTTSPSDSQTLTLAAGPTLDPQIFQTTPTEKGKAEGSISGFEPNKSYQIRPEGSAQWLSVPSDIVEDLAPGTYHVRLMGDDGQLPSASVALIIQSKEKTPSATYDIATNTLSNVESGMEYRVNDGSWTTITASTVTDLLSSDQLTQGTRIDIRHPGDSETLPSDIQEILLSGKTDPGQALESLQGVAPSTPGGQDGKITGLDTATAYQYKEEGGAWITVPLGTNEIGGLSPGSYDVRVSGQGSELPSDGVSVAIKDKAALPPTPTLDGENSTLSGMGTNTEYRTDPAGPWTPISLDPWNFSDLLEELTENPFLEIRQRGDDTHEPSDPLSIPLQVQQAPDTLVAGKGEISGLDGTKSYEIQHPGSSNWTKVPPGTTHLTDLPEGTYHLRLQGQGDLLASPPANLTVTPKSTDTKPSIPPTKPDSGGSSSGGSSSSGGGSQRPEKPDRSVPTPTAPADAKETEKTPPTTSKTPPTTTPSAPKTPTPGAPSAGQIPKIESSGTGTSAGSQETSVDTPDANTADQDTASTDEQEPLEDEEKEEVRPEEKPADQQTPADAPAERQALAIKWWMWAIPAAVLLLFFFLLAARRRKKDDNA